MMPTSSITNSIACPNCGAAANKKTGKPFTHWGLIGHQRACPALQTQAGQAGARPDSLSQRLAPAAGEKSNGQRLDALQTQAGQAGAPALSLSSREEEKQARLLGAEQPENKKT